MPKKLSEKLQAHWSSILLENEKLAAENERLTRERDAAMAAVKAADVLRGNWLNGGHELREPSLSELQRAKMNYDVARRALEQTVSPGKRRQA